MILEIVFTIYILITLIIGKFTYYVGYKNGFKKCKEIDDEIIDNLVNEKHIL